MKDAIISTSKVNCYGFRVLTAGIDHSQYDRNPVLLYMHNRCFDGKTLPIGRMENLRTEGDSLIGTPVFDMADTFAAEVARKWEAGFLRMVSAGLEIAETSTDAALMADGQTRPTVTRCRLMEVSVVDIGANDDALQLTHKGKAVQLAAGIDNEVLPLLSSSKPQDLTTSKPQTPKSQNKMETKDIALLLGLAETADEQAIRTRVAELQNDGKTVKELTDRIQKMEADAIAKSVDTAIKEHRIDLAKRDHFVGLGKKIGAQALAETLAAMTPAVRATDIIKQQASANATLAAKTWDELDRTGKLAELKKADIETFKAKYKEKFGAEYKD
ncbi:MAG: hypothetical protein E7070_05170 [Bacteroidales bacterium]|nr:hypothetical protein [Bacteroidales bacterium]